MKRNNKDTISYQEQYHSTIFTQVYKNNVWGGKKGEFYSGTGSHNPYIAGYAKVVADFIQKEKIGKIVEIGCGDFNVTNTILTTLRDHNYKFSYHGYDVVKPLIERNKALYTSSQVKFTCKDSSIGNISDGDLLIIRQVLQHLDNKSIKKITEKFKNYKYIMVSEHQAAEKYNGMIIPNRDKKTDASNRIMFRSGVYLEKEPFNCAIDSLIYSIPESIGAMDASINTYLLKNKPLT